MSPFVDISFEIISGLFVESARGPKRHRQEPPPQTPPGFQRSITDRIATERNYCSFSEVPKTQSDEIEDAAVISKYSQNDHDNSP
jgi:hypothetical protein